MPAMIEMMFATREKPWHGLGEVVSEALNSEEALKMAGLDWNVIQAPVMYGDQDTGYKINVRDVDQKVLGVVGSRYTPVQNREAFEFTDALIGGDVRYETAGSLNNGKRVWMLAQMPTERILDDEVEPYLCFTNGHDGFNSIKVCMTPIRVVCQNTLNMALKQAKRTWSVRHSKNVKARIEEAKATLELAQHYMKDLALEAESLYQIKISPEQFAQLTNRLFPVDNKDTIRKQIAQETLQYHLKKAWEQDDLGNIRGTGWGFMNAISDMSTHKPPARATDNYRENNFMNTIDNPALLDQAYKMLQDMK